MFWGPRPSYKLSPYPEYIGYIGGLANADPLPLYIGSCASGDPSPLYIGGHINKDPLPLYIGGHVNTDPLPQNIGGQANADPLPLPIGCRAIGDPPLLHDVGNEGVRKGTPLFQLHPETQTPYLSPHLPSMSLKRAVSISLDSWSISEGSRLSKEASSKGRWLILAPLPCFPGQSWIGTFLLVDTLGLTPCSYAARKPMHSSSIQQRHPRSLWDGDSWLCNPSKAHFHGWIYQGGEGKSWELELKPATGGEGGGAPALGSTS